MDAATLSPRLASDAAFSANAMRRPSRGSGVGLMIFGGAALITGLIIGDDAGTVIAVGGALVGLYGLYVYLGRPTGMGHGGRRAQPAHWTRLQAEHQLAGVVLRSIARSAHAPVVVYGLSSTT